MDFIENEEDRQPARAELTQPAPSHPFPLLQLPREIRDVIYYYALIRPGSGPYVDPARICYMHHSASSPHVSDSYWGTEKSTRLFRVSHQVCNEVTSVFYSTFPFHFPQTIKIAMVHATLRDTLPPRARNLITKVGFMILIRGIANRFHLERDETIRQALQAAVDLLPNVKRVELSLAIVGHDVPEWQITEVVNRAVREASPLKGLPGLSIRGGFNENNQRARIVREVREALGCP